MPLLVAVAVVATVVSVKSQMDAADAARENVKLQRTQAEINAAKSRTKAVREARIRRAQVANTSSQTGTAQSSGALGGISSLQSQLGDTIGDSYGQSAFAQAYEKNQQSMLDSQFKAQLAGTVASTASMFSNPKELGRLSKKTQG